MHFVYCRRNTARRREPGTHAPFVTARVWADTWRGDIVKSGAVMDPFVDLIACERDCRNCSYAATLDCDGNCGVCPHNGYCPCVNPVVARSKTALRMIELRPILLRDLRGSY
jgi:hypothetical protein